MSQVYAVAEFQAEAWQDDYAVPVDPRGETEWDCTKAVEADPGYFGNPFEWPDDEFVDRDDRLRDDPAAPPWIREWDGPFTITVYRRERQAG